MKILILSCNTGQGHNSAAEALRGVFHHGGDQCEIVDALSYISPLASDLVSKGHVWLYRNWPWLFGKGYSALDNHPSAMAEGKMAYRFFAIGAQQLHEKCVQGGYDAIICTHVFSALMLTEALKTPGITADTYFVSTDYTCSPGTLESDLDCYFIPHADLAGEFPGKKVVASGIPIRQSFFSRMDKVEAKRRANIGEGQKHMLLMCGSMGCGPVVETARLLAMNKPEDSELSIVCGNNQKLYDELHELFSLDGSVHLYGYTDQVSVLMDSADLFLTKPGGISTTEAMAKGLPMVFIYAVAGCETHNLHFFSRLGGGEGAAEPEEICRICLELLEDDARREEMARLLTEHSTNAAEIICRHVRQQHHIAAAGTTPSCPV